MGVTSEGDQMRFRRFPKLRAAGASAQRLAAAAKAIQRERDRAGLFVEELGPKETPEERIARVDIEMAAHWQRMRDWVARRWRSVRKEFYSLPRELRLRIREEWRACGWPGDPAYFAEFLRWQLAGKRWQYSGSDKEPGQAAFGEPEAVTQPAGEERQPSLF